MRVEGETVPALPGDGEVRELADVFRLLGDASRLRLLVGLLENGELRVGDLARLAGQSESSASHALRLLRAHRIVEVRRSGRAAYYRLADAHVRVLLEVALTHLDHAPPVHEPGAGSTTNAATCGP